MSKHRRPTLVRAWLGEYQTELPAAFVDDWEEREGWAEFHLPLGHDLAKALLRNPYGKEIVAFTVASASAIEWLVDHWSVTRVDGHAALGVRCVSRETHARRCIASDEYLTELWLAAEERHREAA